MDIPFLKKKKKKHEEDEDIDVEEERPLPEELEHFRIERDFGNLETKHREKSRERVRPEHHEHRGMTDEQKIELIIQKLETIDARLKLIEQKLERP